MPNHVINRVEFECSEERLKEILSAICYDEDSQRTQTGIGTIDFNKIIPMPPSLDIECGSNTDNGISLYLTSINPGVQYYGKEKMVPAQFETLLEKLRENMFVFRCRPSLTLDEIQRMTKYRGEEELLQLGKTAVNNMQQYGAITWYDWRIQEDHWNTKWNSYDAYAYDDSNAIYFQTAWDAPHPIIVKLSSMYPEVTIKHQWANEDLMQDCGSMTYLNGKMIDCVTPETDMEHLEMAASIWECDLEDYGYVRSLSKTAYVNIENNEYNLVSVCGKPGMLSPQYLREDDVPEGLYLYYLRGGHDGEEFYAIDSKPRAKKGGAVVTKTPLELGKDGFLLLDSNHTIESSGEDLTFKEFMERDFENKEAMNIEQN